MEFSTPILLVCTLLCYLDQVHLISVQINKGSLPFRSLAATSPLEGSFTECGKSKKNGTHIDKLSIRGGHNATLGDWPWMAALFEGHPKWAPSDNHFRCGGSLISDQWIITSASCFYGQKNPSWFARLGGLHLNNTVTDGVQAVDVIFHDDDVISHPEYTPNSLTADIALICLQKTVTFTDYVHPICLPSGPKYEPDQYYVEQPSPYIAGWGAMKEDKVYVDILQEASVQVVRQKICKEEYANDISMTIDKNVICAKKQGISECCGDSGGPLMFFNSTTHRFYLGGIVTAEKGCTGGNVSATFTKVAQYISFINKITGKNF